MGRIIGAYVAAVLVGGIASVVASTQVVLQHLVQIGAEISLAARWDATLTDIIGFGPTFLALTAIGYAIAFPTAALISRLIGGLRTFGYILAGFVMIMVMLKSIEIFYQNVLDSTITPIATARTLWGLAGIGLGGAFGGGVFAWLACRR